MLSAVAVRCSAGAGEESADRRARVLEERLEHHGRFPRVHIARRRRLLAHVRDQESANLRHSARLSTASHPPSASARPISITIAVVVVVVVVVVVAAAATTTASATTTTTTTEDYGLLTLTAYNSTTPPSRLKE